MLNFKWLKNLFKRKNFAEKVRDDLKEIMPVMKSETKDGKISEPDTKKLTRKEKRKARKEKIKSRPLSRRVLRQFMKTLFIRLPLTVVVIVAAILFFLQLYLKPAVVENLAKANFANVSYGSLDLKVESFSPYTGFVIRDIVVRSGEDFGRAKLFEMEKLVFRYGFFPIFTGSIKFPEIGLYKPRVYLFQKKGIWNVSTLMKPSEQKPEKPKKEKKEEDDDDEEPSSEIRLPIAVDFLFNFILDDFRVYARGEEFTTEMTGLSFNANIDVPPVKVIPKTVEAVRIFKTMKFELNPKNSMEVKFYSKDAATAPELILNWRLVFNNGEKPEFSSQLNAGARRMPLRLQKKFFSPFNFLVSYDMIYNPVNDILKINDFSFSFMNSDWISLSGTVSSVTKRQVLNINMDRSIIPLKDLYPYFVLMTGDRSTRFGGDVSLYPLTIRGDAKNPDVKGRVSLKKLYFRVPGTEASIGYLGLDYSAVMSGSRMELGADLNIPHMAYVIDGSKSGDNGVKLTVSATSFDNFGKVRINDVSLGFFSPSAGRVLDLSLNGDVKLGKATEGEVKISKLKLNTQPLGSMVPGRFKKQVAGIPLKKPVDINAGARFYLGSDIIRAGVELLAAVPDYGVSDLKLKGNVTQEIRLQRVTIESLYLGSRNMNLALNAAGSVDLKKTPLSDSNLKVTLELNNPAMKSVWGPWRSSGKMKLSATMKGDLEKGKARGTLEFKDFNLNNEIQKLDVAGMNMDFPFEYSFSNMKKEGTYIGVTQKQVLESEHFSEKPNFSVSSVKAAHPVRKISFEYVKDFSSHMVFRDNVFRITNLKADVMDGSLLGRTILFNLADFKLKNMEFSVLLDVSNVNIGRLDDPDRKNISKSGEISLNANFSGKGLNVNRELNPSGYISIYKIGNKFADRLMKGLSQEKGKSKLGKPVQKVVDNSIPRSFDFRLDKGLVYTTVKFSGKGVLNKIIKVENDEVVFDRIPLQEYFRKVSEAE